MNYSEASKVRKTGLGALITNQIVSGQSVRSSVGRSISQKSSAYWTGAKQAMDPMTVARFLTRSNAAAAIVGRMLGRSIDDIGYITGTPKRTYTKRSEYWNKVGMAAQGGQKATTELKKIYAFMRKSREQDLREFEISMMFEEFNDNIKQERHKEVMDVFRKAISKQKRAESRIKKDVKKEVKKAPEEAKGKPAETPAETPRPTTGKPTPKAETPKAETAKPAPKAETPKPAETAKPAPKAETPKPAETAKPAPKAEPTKPAEIPKKAEAPPPKVEAPKPTAKPVTEAAKETAKTATRYTGNKALVLSALVAAGYSKAAQANIMANVDAESNFQPRSEQIFRYTAKNIFDLYGPGNKAGNSVTVNSMEEAQALVASGRENLANVIYGTGPRAKKLGNTQPGDGYKYIGRGFIQITGRYNYTAVSKEIGVDLVNNPELANDPVIAAKIVPAYFKLKLDKRKSLESIQDVNSMVGFGNEASRVKRIELSKKYNTELLPEVSAENANMKNDLTKPGNTVIQQNNVQTNVNVNQTQTTVAPPAKNVNPALR